MRQRTADLDYSVPWNRHLLTCLRYVLKATCLVGARAVSFNPHFSYFLSPDCSESVLGSSMGWSAELALLLLDSFTPLQREAITQQACYHTHEVWMLRQDRPSHCAVAGMQLIRRHHASLGAVLPPNSLLLHASSCWSDAKWDGAPLNYATQIWYLPRIHDIINLVALASAQRRQQEVMRTFP